MWHLSILYRTGPLHSHTAGKFPAHESPSCAVWYRLPPDGALVCRFWSRSGERSKTLRCSLMIAGRGLLHALQRWWPKDIVMTLGKNPTLQPEVHTILLLVLSSMKLSFMMESLRFLSLDSPSNHVNPLLSILISCRLNIKFHEETSWRCASSSLYFGMVCS